MRRESLEAMSVNLPITSARVIILRSTRSILETLYPDYGYLVYTADEWVTECERNA